MSGWVVDSSFALAWGLTDEAASARVARFLDRLTLGDMIWVPSLWWYEVANVLLVAERRGRITEAEALRALELFRSLRLETDSSPSVEALWRLRTAGKEHGLSAYDAAYLELAMRRQLPLATFDQALLKAAKAAGVRTHE